MHVNLRRGFSCVTLLALALAGCAPVIEARKAELEARNLPPQDMRSDVVAFLRVYLNDPTDIRDGAITEPMLKRVGPIDRYIVCVRYNAKRDGRYVGVRENVVVFVSGKLNEFIELDRDGSSREPATNGLCKGVTYQPFPEIGRITR
jgi:hypothetical protein